MSMYARLMGSRFEHLDAGVRAFHRLAGRHVLHGMVRTEAPATWLARLAGRLLGSPTQAGSGAIRFELDAEPEREVWTRHFPSRTMRSCLALGAHGLTEQLGPVRLRFDLAEQDGQLLMHLRCMHVLGVPCPRWAMPRVVAQESGRDGRLHFRVAAALPLIGQVTAYSGYLELPQESVP